MSEEAIAKIPGTTYSLKFGYEGKYYAVFLCRGSSPFKTRQLWIIIAHLLPLSGVPCFSPTRWPDGSTSATPNSTISFSH